MITGHVDSRGTAHTAKTLSDDRAAATAKYLSHFLKVTIVKEGKGASVPVGSNKTAAGQAQNRRAEILVM